MTREERIKEFGIEFCEMIDRIKKEVGSTEVLIVPRKEEVVYEPLPERFCRKQRM